MTRESLRDEEQEAVDRALAQHRRTRRRRRAWFLLPLLIILSGTVAAITVSGRLEGEPQKAAWTIIASFTVALAAASVALISALIVPAGVKTLELSLEYVEKQLSDLWGPLAGLVRAGQYHYKHLLPQIVTDKAELLRVEPRKRDGDDPDDPLAFIRRADISLDPFSLVEIGAAGGGQAWKLWNSYADDQSLDRNTKIAELISTQFALIGQDDFEDFKFFLEHDVEYRGALHAVRMQISRSGKVTTIKPLSHLYPEAFEYHIHHKLRFLRALQKKYRLQLQKAPDRDIEDAVKLAARYRARVKASPAN